MRSTGRYALAVATAATCLVAMGAVAAAAAPAGAAHSSGGCRLDNGISHVVQVQFDNVHFTRDNPNIPSDLEQMPHLSQFLQRNGTILSNDHDVLVHTATNFLSTQTGLYEDRHSVTQSNSFSYYDATGATHPGVSFAYWTAPLYDPTGNPADTKYNLNYSADRNAN